MTDSHSPISKRTITVVDDDLEIVSLVRVILEQEGFNVRCAYSGKDLFAGLEKEKPDLIILDVMMPEVDGLVVLARLKDAPETSSIPVILLTVLEQHEDVLAGYKTGADYYMTKPFTRIQLIAGINRLLSRDQGDSVESP